MKSDLVGCAGTQPVGDVLKAFTFPPEHPAGLRGEECLCFPLCVEQPQPTLLHWVAELLQLQPPHRYTPPE